MATNPVSKRFFLSQREGHRELLKNSGGKYRITPKQYTDILKIFIREIKNRMIKDAYIWHLPFNMGAFYIKGYKIKNRTLYRPWQGEASKVRNLHTFGKYFKIMFDKTYMIRANKSYVKFKPCKKFKNELKNEIMERSENPLLSDFIAH